jgi:hypothetical protein
MPQARYDRLTREARTIDQALHVADRRAGEIGEVANIPRHAVWPRSHDQSRCCMASRGGALGADDPLDGDAVRPRKDEAENRGRHQISSLQGGRRLSRSVPQVKEKAKNGSSGRMPSTAYPVMKIATGTIGRDDSLSDTEPVR